jgi:hypothetical protein
MNLTREVLTERALAKEANKKIIEEALTLLKDLHSGRYTIEFAMDPKEAEVMIREAFQSLSEL